MALAPRVVLVVMLLGVPLWLVACTGAPTLPTQALAPAAQVAQPPTPTQNAPQPTPAPATQLDLAGQWAGQTEWPGLTFGITFVVAEGSAEVSDLKVTFTCPGSQEPAGNLTMPPSQIQDNAFAAFGTQAEFVSSSEAKGTFDNAMRIECGQAMVPMSGEWVATKTGMPPHATPVPHTVTPVPQSATPASPSLSAGSAGTFRIGEAELQVASVELEPASQGSAAVADLAEYNVLAVRASVLSGEPVAVLGAPVAVSDEAGNTQSSGYGHSAEDTVIWLFPVRPDARQFRLLFPNGLLDLPPPDVTLPAEPTATPQPSPTATPQPSPTTPPDATVQLDRLNLRDGPGEEFPSLQLLQQGDHLTVLGKYGDCAWLNVIAPDGHSGWVSGESRYVTLVVPCDAIRLASYRPLTGEVQRRVFGYRAMGWLEIENGTDFDGLVILVDANTFPAIAAYIRAGETHRITSVPDGVYSIYFAKGEGWDSQRLRFSTNETLRRFADTVTFTSTATTYRTWNITLHGVPGGKGATEVVPEDSFPALRGRW